MEHPVSMILDLSPGLNEKLGHLAKANGATPEEVLLKGLALYGVASEAKRKNQHLGIVDAERRVVAEVTGV